MRSRQRYTRPHDDHYPTPPEAVRALLAHEAFDGPIWEPCAGSGEMVNALSEAGHEVVATTLLSGCGTISGGRDFLTEPRILAPNIVTNPPYKNGIHKQMIAHALSMRPRKAAFLLPVDYRATEERYFGIHSAHPPSRCWEFIDRVTMYPAGWTGKRNNSPRRYAWYVWDADAPGQWPHIPTTMIWAKPHKQQG